MCVRYYHVSSTRKRTYLYVTDTSTRINHQHKTIDRLIPCKFPNIRMCEPIVQRYKPCGIRELFQNFLELYAIIFEKSF
ncbi:uncharacterized protein SOCG_05359 [Schizosaccharomyces octosporus yFS286]|uniref:Uncharacterized protein n=1 Tax=Schizosaccharomyces octosporus (strain yFS286) TaxID=483514 RepID=S9RMR0_SCHOY|nr:uncharacterized protein SOCG_05359 [Schizosaccharomyces octosporus yFS286]EPX75244.1 hypothetical protein SOCG_05359 [Schizosaccharomyces octosporus yFS286]